MADGSIRNVVVACALVLGTFLSGGLQAQSLDGTGLVATGVLLRQMDGVKRVLMIGAHPDDENTAVLAELARGMGAQTAYLSLTRGDGGQNLIGPELWDGLGVIRTGELEAARRLDGGVQFFTRAFDFGFSKTGEEALRLWPREELLADVVWVVRRFRPQVIISVFTGTPADGHGQHQASGIMAREAFQAAGDPSRFPEQLAEGVEPWTPLKLYGGVWRRPSEATVRLETGAFDPLLGRSVYQLAMESRSFHRSQDMGAARPMGPQLSGMRLEEGRGGIHAGSDDGLFAGVDTTLAGVAASLSGAPAAEAVRHLEAYRVSLGEARERFGGSDPFAIVAPLRAALEHLEAAHRVAGAQPGVELQNVLAERIGLARRALLAAAGVTLDLRASDDVVTPGQTLQVTAYAWNGGPVTLHRGEVMLFHPEGWGVERIRTEGVAPDGSVAPGTLATWVYDVTPPEDADPSRLYYLTEPRDGAMYRWPNEPRLRGLPRDPAVVRAAFDFDIVVEGTGTSVGNAVGWSFVGVNQARGEFRRPVLVVPALSVSLAPGGRVWPLSRTEPATVTVVLRGEGKEPIAGTLRMAAPAGWQVSPREVAFEVGAEGGERSFTFQVRPEAGAEAGEHVFRAEAHTHDGTVFDESVAFIDYEHIERTALFTPAELRITAVPVQVAPDLRVGYIMGTGDDGPEAIRQLGGEVTLLDPDAVRAGAFSGFDAVIVGVRAYETREDLRSANAQLLEYARDGGTVLVQYNQYDFPRGGYTPYPVEMERPARRVAEEDAEVRILQPDAPVFTRPNRITSDDFRGWVQERGLYFLSDWDDAFTPLLEMNDRGEPPTRGSLLVAPVGDGLYLYVGLSFFRQWSSGVPGAYRLWANLISLTGEDWRAFSH